MAARRRRPTRLRGSRVPAAVRLLPDEITPLCRKLPDGLTLRDTKNGRPPARGAGAPRLESGTNAEGRPLSWSMIFALVCACATPATRAIRFPLRGPRPEEDDVEFINARPRGLLTHTPAGLMSSGQAPAAFSAQGTTADGNATGCSPSLPASLPIPAAAGGGVRFHRSAPSRFEDAALPGRPGPHSRRHIRPDKRQTTATSAGRPDESLRSSLAPVEPGRVWATR